LVSGHKLRVFVKQLDNGVVNRLVGIPDFQRFIGGNFSDFFGKAADWTVNAYGIYVCKYEGQKQNDDQRRHGEFPYERGLPQYIRIWLQICESPAEGVRMNLADEIFRSVNVK